MKQVGHTEHGSLLVELLESTGVNGLLGQYTADLDDGRILTITSTDFTVSTDENALSGHFQWTRNSRDADGKHITETASEIVRGTFKPADSGAVVTLTADSIEPPDAESWISAGVGGTYTVVCEKASDTLKLTGTRFATATVSMARQKFVSWDEHIESLYGWEATESDEDALPAGYSIIDDGGNWSPEDDAQLASFMNSHSETFTVDELKEKELFAKLQKFPRICNREKQHLVARASALGRISKMLIGCLPMVDFDSSDAATSASQVKGLRTLILRSDKVGIVGRVLKQVKKTDISRPNIKIDRTKARWESDHDPTGENSIFGQIYTALGTAASTNAIFRGADRWWTVSFVNEHVSDAGGGFRETVSNISDDLNSTRTPLFIPTPNASGEVGDMRDAWMPSPGERLSSFSHKRGVCFGSP